jgi:hypothetical protein
VGRQKKITTGVKVSFYVPPEWHNIMKSIAEENAITIADLYRQAVKEFIEKRRTIQKNRKMK